MGNTNIKTVHLVFKTHLDLGFTDLAASVALTYFDRFLPAAIDIAEELRNRGGKERFVWTTGSWLIYEYLEQAGRQERKRIEDAILRGDIKWHALPFTTYTELMDPELFRFGLSLSQKLDKRYGMQTVAGKMTDVPGHTRAIVPMLAEAGIRLLHIGCNSASSAPEVPPVFRWMAPDGSAVTVIYSFGYGDLHQIDGCEDVLMFANTHDNEGPNSISGILGAFQQAQKQFPDAEVKASTLDAFAQTLDAADNKLPVITQEIGDTWIHGTGCDPQKVSRYKELLRLRTEWMQKGVQDQDLDKFNRALLLVPEHTWGIDIKNHLCDYRNQGMDDFARARARDEFDVADNPAWAMPYVEWILQWTKPTKRYSWVESSWKEKRAYVDRAVEGLPVKLQNEARERLDRIVPSPVSLDGFTKRDTDVVFDAGGFTAALDPETGALRTLCHKKTGKNWCSDEHLIGLARYETFTEEDYKRYMRDYNVNCDQKWQWVYPDFGRMGLDAVVPKPEHRMVSAMLDGVYTKNNSSGDVLLVLLRMPEAVVAIGAPARMAVEYSFGKDAIAVHGRWFDKKATRYPEAMWFSFSPVVEQPQLWMMKKMGTPVSPLDVVSRGNRNLHSVNPGIYYYGPDGALTIESLDTPLVAPGTPRILSFDNTLPDLVKGMHFNLHNNLWSTNFVLWYEDDGTFRFDLRF